MYVLQMKALEIQLNSFDFIQSCVLQCASWLYVCECSKCEMLNKYIYDCYSKTRHCFLQSIIGFVYFHIPLGTQYVSSVVAKSFICWINKNVYAHFGAFTTSFAVSKVYRLLSECQSCWIGFTFSLLFVVWKFFNEIFGNLCKFKIKIKFQLSSACNIPLP